MIDGSAGHVLMTYQAVTRCVAVDVVESCLKAHNERRGVEGTVRGKID